MRRPTGSKETNAGAVEAAIATRRWMTAQRKIYERESAVATRQLSLITRPTASSSARKGSCVMFGSMRMDEFRELYESLRAAPAPQTRSELLRSIMRDGQATHLPPLDFKTLPLVLATLTPAAALDVDGELRQFIVRVVTEPVWRDGWYMHGVEGEFPHSVRRVVCLGEPAEVDDEVLVDGVLCTTWHRAYGEERERLPGWFELRVRGNVVGVP